MWLAASVHTVVTVARKWRWCPVVYEETDDFGSKRTLQSPVLEFTSKLKEKTLGRSIKKLHGRSGSSGNILSRRGRRKSLKKSEDSAHKDIETEPETAIKDLEEDASSEQDSRIVPKKKKFDVFKEDDLGTGLNAHIQLEDFKMTIDILYKLTMKNSLEENTVIQLLGMIFFVIFCWVFKDELRIPI